VYRELDEQALASYCSKRDRLAEEELYRRYADRVFALCRRYVGGGASGDWCVGATLAGKEIPRDGFSFSLLGAGGVQFNMTRHLGLYVEPEISWTLPSEKRVLETYRSAHPFLFSVATGLRINLDK